MIECFHFSHRDEYVSSLHSHEQGQFFILLQGAVVYLTEQGEHLMTASRPCWIPPRIAHGVKSRGEMEGITIHVDSLLCTGLPVTISMFKPNGFIDVLTEKMLAVNADPKRLLNLWQTLGDELKTAEQDNFYLPAPKNEKLRKLTEMLAQNSADSRSLSDWANEINMAQRTLVRKFRNETGMSFVEWRQRARVMQAIKLLSAGQSVTDVAMSVGYDSLSAFIAVFKQIMGVSPTQYLQEAAASLRA